MEFVCTSLIAAGAKKIVHIGVCGSLKNNISIGDVILAESAYVNDDTSKCHTKEKIMGIAKTDQDKAPGRISQKRRARGDIL